MTRESNFESLIVLLERAKEQAVALNLGEHFISDLSHLLSTSRENAALLRKQLESKPKE